MPTQTSGHTRRMRILATFPLMLATAACVGSSANESMEGNLRTLEVSAPDFHGVTGDPLEDACRAWTLSPRQVDAFFRISRTYSQAPYGDFYQIACGISGRLSAEGREWTFAINGGGTATWHDGGAVRHFGCSALECEPLLLLPPDGMAPD